MKIFHVVESTATGTLSMICLLANAQALAGEEVTIIYSARDETPTELHHYFNVDVKLVNIQISSLFQLLPGIFQLRNLLREESTCVFFHSSFAGFFGRISSIGLTGNYFYIPHCIGFMREDLNYAKRLIFVLLERFASIKKCTYIACSASEQSSIMKELPKSKCVLVENAAVVSRWKFETEWEDRRNCVITVGQIRQQKDPVRFARIAKIVKKTLPMDFIWVGDGSDDASKKILLEAGVIITGWEPPEAVKLLLTQSKYYLSTSLWEGMPISPIEAMLSGCVVVLSDCKGNVDIIENKKTGIIFSSTNEGAEFLIKLNSDTAFAEQLSTRGRNSGRVRFSAERYIEEIDALVRGS